MASLRLASKPRLMDKIPSSSTVGGSITADVIEILS